MSEEKPNRPFPSTISLAAAAVGIFAFGAILQTAESILAPLVLALVTGIVLSPIAVSWERVGIPSSLGAVLNLFIALVAIGGTLFLLQPIATRLVNQAPKVAADVEATLVDFRETLKGIDEVSKGVADVMSMDGSGSDTVDLTTAPAPETKPAKEEAPVPSVTDALWLAPSLLAQIAIFAGTLFFFLATRVEIYKWLSRHVPWPEPPSKIEAKLLEAERRVSRYFLTVAIINACLGLAVFGALRQLGLPGAPVWGLVAFLANFVLYLGPASFFVAMLYAGIAAFDGPTSILPAAVYIGINFIEAQFVTPTAVGRQMDLNPLVVFLAVVFGIWLWGPIGGIVAIPLLVWLLVINGFKNFEPEEKQEQAS